MPFNINQTYEYYTGRTLFSDSPDYSEPSMSLSECRMFTGLIVFSPIAVFLLYHYTYQKIHCNKDNDCEPNKIELISGLLLLTLISLCVGVLAGQKCVRRSGYTQLNGTNEADLEANQLDELDCDPDAIQMVSLSPAPTQK